MKKRILTLITTLLVVMLAMAGCGQKEKLVKDREGNDFKVPEKINRIVSTAPSNTEILVELGLADKLVAVDKYSADIPGLPKNIKLIDFSNPDPEAIVSLNPDMIIASGHNKTGKSEDPFKVVKDAGISVAYIPSSDSIKGIYDDIMFISDITGTQNKGEKIVENMKSQIAEVEKIGKSIKGKKKVYFEIGPAPNLYSFGNKTFLNEMIELVGGENIFKGQDGWISPSAESIIEKNPDVIITNVNYVPDAVKEIKNREGWQNIAAIKNGQVYLVDANTTSRPSQNITKALNQMAEYINPDAYAKQK
ncbi:ABC transporter substrate-binding protein [Paraclostridium sordellii]|uniref:Periplasmic binding protein n=1 Tax=Paraclostridium sordellii TaxID=1505 RepID=A0A0C7QJ70_PARSO|nr:ABC transporter substrate-binding protein [Paeniclostridium sordellii]QYE97055.1 ABC transporter substrate-binding protein [Paeniclostridium sordellii]CEN22270.1 periplasmic binding protein [[Clostridium] sordellii] [Paeniclostridium sordellii]CEN79062.1 periplasmic binding protein [[Clostridium] sordellii] [Paeniclostridium sordellii]CEP88603.1 periplasmic binding protein [[Clostridium] sordellii] [Paeniclostridium sordellii]CEP96898.1 periplasmic binding protein [[Clostridium] sordellii] 